MNSTTQALLIAIVTTPAALGEARYLSDIAASLGFAADIFRATVLSAWYEGRVELTRADLVFDRAKVEASCLRVETEEFHYIALAG